jgi:spore germination protein YaaH
VPGRRTVPRGDTDAALAAPDAIQDHEVWLEGAASAGARLPLADRYQTAGVSTWRLGHEDPTFWTVIERWRRDEP